MNTNSKGGSKNDRATRQDHELAGGQRRLHADQSVMVEHKNTGRAILHAQDADHPGAQSVPDHGAERQRSRRSINQLMQTDRVERHAAGLAAHERAEQLRRRQHRARHGVHQDRSDTVRGHHPVLRLQHIRNQYERERRRDTPRQKYGGGVLADIISRLEVAA